MNYEKEQERLLRMLEEVPTDIEYDDEEEDSTDHCEEREGDSESEQELDSGEEGNAEQNDVPYFTGKDNTTKWKKHLPPQNIRTRSKNIVTHLPGVKGPVRNLKTPIEIWNCFFTMNILTAIVENTNKFIESVQDKYERSRNAKPTDITEIKALLGLLYIFGRSKKEQSSQCRGLVEDRRNIHGNISSHNVSLSIPLFIATFKI